MSKAQSLTVWRQRLVESLQEKNLAQANAVLFDAESELGSEQVIALIETTELSDLRVLAESADRSIGSPLLAHISPDKLAELLSYQIRHEHLFHDPVSPVASILFGTFFREDVQDDPELQERYLDALFDPRHELVQRFLLLMEEAFSSGRTWQTNPFIDPPPRTDPDTLASDYEMRSDDPWRTESVGTYVEDAEDLPLGRFTRWFEAAKAHPGEFQDEGPRQFLLAICALRPEYALALHDCHARREETLESESTGVTQPPSPDRANPVPDSERMF